MIGFEPLLRKITVEELSDRIRILRNVYLLDVDPDTLSTHVDYIDRLNHYLKYHPLPTIGEQSHAV